MKFSLPLHFLLAGSLSGCVLDPATLISDSIMIAVDAAGPSDAEIKAEDDAYMRQALVADDRTKSCAQLTAFWPEVRESQLQNPPYGPISVEAREQVMAEKGCVIPSPLAQATAQAEPGTSTAVSKPTAVIPMAAAPTNHSAATSSSSVVISTTPGASTATASLAQQSAIPAGAMYCTAVLATQHTYGATASPVKLIAGAASDMQPSLKSYIAQVKQVQPGVWGDFKLNTAVCAPGAVVCMAEAKGPTGKTQNAFEFCHVTQAKADAQLNQMRQGDPQAVIVNWP